MLASACSEWLFKDEHPEFCDRIRAARDAGLRGVELHLWRDEPLDGIRDTRAATGL